jgi:hypothetical protein
MSLLRSRFGTPSPNATATSSGQKILINTRKRLYARIPSKLRRRGKRKHVEKTGASFERIDLQEPGKVNRTTYL